MANSQDKPIVALIYDFDGTLSPGNMQEFSFIKALNMSADEFWAKSTALSKKTDANSILCYMKTMLDEAKYRNIAITRQSFADFGREVQLFDGVQEWFGLINNVADKNGLKIEHYINSSGLKEMIEGTIIAKEFKQIYACSFLYDINGVAQWPAVSVDFTTKTQFMFKINKGISEVSDSTRINEYVKESERRIPFKRMIYFGDGETDIPSMKMVKLNGGYSIAVYDDNDDKKKLRASKLIIDNRANFCCKADYRQDNQIFNVVKTILNKIKYDYEFDKMLATHYDSAYSLSNSSE